ncbi:hypothetical protein V6N13_032349 [Hibiscus sabdariffa]
MVFLLETKLDSLSDSLIASFWWTNSFRFEFSPSVGLLGVYSPCELGAQLDLWLKLIEVVQGIDIPVCCGGDFNVVVSMAEPHGCIRNMRGMWQGHVRAMELEWKCRLSGVVLVSFVNKLHALKVYLKVWNRETFGSVDLQIEVVSGLLNALDERGMAEVSIEVATEEWRKLQGQLWHLLKYGESI